MSSNDNTLAPHTPAPSTDVERASGRPASPPRVDIRETPAGTVLEADMPGLQPDDVELRLEENVLTLIGHTKPQDVGGHSLAYSEYVPGEYYRAFALSDAVDQAKIEATVTNGVLRVRLPKAEHTMPRAIPVTAAKS